jgi:DNA-binding FadR family transcriptional regulator
MPIQTIDSDRLYRKIARQLSGLIDAGEFKPGERLPAERELAQQFGVSRPSVREALIALEIQGKVEVRVGSGVFVATPRPTVVRCAVEEGEGPFELIQARKLIEGETAAVAAREATSAEVEAIGVAVEEMHRCHQRGESTDAADRSFHTNIARATHNHVLASVVQMLWDEGRGAIWKTMEKHFQTPALRAATLRDHRAVHEAIAEHDARAARTAMHRHLSRVAQEFASGWDLYKKRHARPSTKTAP